MLANLLHNMFTFINTRHNLSMLRVSVLTQLSFNNLLISFPIYIPRCLNSPSALTSAATSASFHQLVFSQSVIQELILLIPYFTPVNAHSSSHRPCHCGSIVCLVPLMPVCPQAASVSLSHFLSVSSQFHILLN